MSANRGRNPDYDGGESLANRPVANIHVGSVQASVCRNQNDNGTFFSIT